MAASPANVTTPTRKPGGTSWRNDDAAALAAVNRSGFTSVASMESLTSIASTTVAVVSLRSSRTWANSSSRQVEAPNSKAYGAALRSAPPTSARTASLP